MWIDANMTMLTDGQLITRMKHCGSLSAALASLGDAVWSDDGPAERGIEDPPSCRIRHRSPLEIKEASGR